jgi:hypothetical protein
MGVYWLLADYGRNFIRPLVALVASIFVFHAAYSIVLSPPPAMSETTFRNAIWAFTIANAVPFVGALSLEKELKDTILCAAQPFSFLRSDSRSLADCSSSLSHSHCAISSSCADRQWDVPTVVRDRAARSPATRRPSCNADSDEVARCSDMMSPGVRCLAG